MWDVLNRVDEIQALVQEHYPELAPKVCKKLHLISRIGEAALVRFANDVDLITAIRYFRIFLEISFVESDDF